VDYELLVYWEAHMRTRQTSTTAVPGVLTAQGCWDREPSVLSACADIHMLWATQSTMGPATASLGAELVGDRKQAWRSWAPGWCGNCRGSQEL